jgi:hypothetical protein
MKKYLTTLLLLLPVLTAFAQAPFTTLVKEPRAVVRRETPDGPVFLSADSVETRKALESPDDTEAEPTTKRDVDFFSSNSLSLNLINKGNNRVSINSQVLHYKLYIANPNEDNYYR